MQCSVYHSLKLFSKNVTTTVFHFAKSVRVCISVIGASVVFLIQDQHIHQSTSLRNMLAKSFFYYVGQVTGEHVGQVTSEHVGQVTGEHVGEVTGEHVGQVTGEHLAKSPVCRPTCSPVTSPTCSLVN